MAAKELTVKKGRSVKISKKLSGKLREQRIKKLFPLRKQHRHVNEKGIFARYKEKKELYNLEQILAEDVLPDVRNRFDEIHYKHYEQEEALNREAAEDFLNFIMRADFNNINTLGSIDEWLKDVSLQDLANLIPIQIKQKFFPNLPGNYTAGQMLTTGGTDFEKQLSLLIAGAITITVKNEKGKMTAVKNIKKKVKLINIGTELRQYELDLNDQDLIKNMKKKKLIDSYQLTPEGRELISVSGQGKVDIRSLRGAKDNEGNELLISISQDRSYTDKCKRALAFLTSNNFSLKGYSSETVRGGGWSLGSTSHLMALTSMIGSSSIPSNKKSALVHFLLNHISPQSKGNKYINWIDSLHRKASYNFSDSFIYNLWVLICLYELTGMGLVNTVDYLILYEREMANVIDSKGRQVYTKKKNGTKMYKAKQFVQGNYIRIISVYDIYTAILLTKMEAFVQNSAKKFSLYENTIFRLGD